jgi:Uma2 family endonuclease
MRQAVGSINLAAHGVLRSFGVYGKVFLMGQPAEKLYTVSQYAALEADSSVKHEYVDGVVTAMAGATPVHCYVTAGIIAVMKAKLQGRPCQPFSSDLKIKTGDNYHYPDVSIVCRPVIRDDEIPDAVVNPGVIFEAISPGTQAYDRGAKFAQYRLIAELQDYILVSPTRVYAEHYSKTGDERWNLESLGAGSVLRLPSIESQVPLDSFYEGLDLLGDA